MVPAGGCLTGVEQPVPARTDCVPVIVDTMLDVVVYVVTKVVVSVETDVVVWRLLTPDKYPTPRLPATRTTSITARISFFNLSRERKAPSIYAYS